MGPGIIIPSEAVKRIRCGVQADRGKAPGTRGLDRGIRRFKACIVSIFIVINCVRTGAADKAEMDVIAFVNGRITVASENRIGCCFLRSPATIPFLSPNGKTGRCIQAKHITAGQGHGLNALNIPGRPYPAGQLVGEAGSD